MVVALQADATTLDPHAANDAGALRMLENIHSTLYRHTETYGEIEPYLAEDSEVSEDGKTYTFRLREGVRFHSGRDLTAEDVVWSLRRIREEGVRSEQLEPVESMEAVDERTVRLTLSAPHTPLLTALAHPMAAIMDREAVEAADGRFDQLDAGSGPYRLVSWRRGRQLELEAFPEYHEEGVPRVPRLVYRPIPDATAATTALRTGDVDLILDLNPRDIQRLEDIPGVSVVSAPGTFWEYIGLNTAEAPFDDPRVRQAIAHAIDREALARMVKFGHATPITGGHIPAHHPAHLDEEFYPSRDLGRARALLEEAGITDTLRVTCIVGSDFDYQVNAAQVIKQQLLEVDIDVTVAPLESGVFFSRLGQQDFEMTVVGWLGFVDADEWTYDLFHSRGAFNQQGYENEEVDALLESARREPDGESRLEMYREVQRIVAKDAPMVFLYLTDRATALAEEIEGFDPHPTLTTLSLRRAGWRD